MSNTAPVPGQDEPFYIVTKEGKETKVMLYDVIDLKDTWKVGRSKILSLVGVQKIADREGIVEKKFETHIQPSESNRQQHGVNVWIGFKGDNNPENWVRASGEASILNTGKFRKDDKGGRIYDEWDAIDSKYRYAMADKRAFCRAVPKLIRLYGFYTEIESPDFVAPAQALAQANTQIDGQDISDAQDNGGKFDY